jgi:hypothetical protein
MPYMFFFLLLQNVGMYFSKKMQFLQIIFGSIFQCYDIIIVVAAHRRVPTLRDTAKYFLTIGE